MGRSNIQKERRAQILEALGKCLLKKSFRETTIKDISDMAGTTHGILHYYFKSKNDILLNFIDSRIEKYIIIVNNFNTENLNNLAPEKIIEKMYQYTLSNFISSRNDIKILFEIWSIANYDKNINNKLKKAYSTVQRLGTESLKKAGYNERTASLFFKSLLAQLTGLGMFSGLLNDTNDTKELLKLFYKNL